MQRLYQMFDKVAGAVEGPIVACRNDGPAIRMFYDVLKNPQTSPGAHPADFDFILVGTQDDNGVITPCDPPLPVALGAGWVAAQVRDSSREGDNAQ